MWVSLVLGFLLGALAIIVAQALGFLFLLNRLSTKYSSKVNQSSQLPNQDLDPQQSLSFAYNKQGVLWVLEPEKVPKLLPGEKLPKEKKSKKEILEVFPVKKRANIKSHSLILTNSDGSLATIDLVGCRILSVSASDLPSRKWAKRYPIKVEGKNSAIYNGSRTIYIYLETSWEKESWCKALRLASCVNKEKENWYAKLKNEFNSYLRTLNSENPSFKKPIIELSGEPIGSDRANKFEGTPSKVRLFLKKLTRKASKSAMENKGIVRSISSCDERKVGEKSRSPHDLLSAPASLRYPLAEFITNNNASDEDTMLPLPLNISRSGSQSHDTLISDANSTDKFGVDEGTLCFNLLISRLFFDAKRNGKIKSSMQARIQRTLSNMRTPSYVGGVTCTGLDLGSLPPHIHSMRILPMDMNEVWAIEVDIEYSGGALLDVETRLEVREPGFQKGLVDKSLESSSVGEATPDLLEELEYLENQMNRSGEIVEQIEKKQEGDKNTDARKLSKCASWKSGSTSRWKSILNSIANQVSQVPLSLTIKIASIRGTMRLHIKPPPSDQLWFSFTSMPDIDFGLESSVGDHKISSGQVASILENRFKAAIRDTLVLPNCESVCIPWMIAEKDDWVPRKAAPFIWLNQAAQESTSSEVSNSQTGEVQSELEHSKRSELSPNNHLEVKHDKIKTVAFTQEPTPGQLEQVMSSSEPSLSASSSISQSNYTRTLQDLKTPLLSDDSSESSKSRSVTLESQSASEFGSSERNFPAGEDANSRRAGVSRRARMMDLGKKMGEKLEEKRRHIEEKSRNIVDKMRGP